MQSQLGMTTPFFHGAPCGGQIVQERAPEQTGRSAFSTWQPDLKYFCTKCNQFVETYDVVEKQGTRAVGLPKLIVKEVPTPTTPAVIASTPDVPPEAPKGE